MVVEEVLGVYNKRQRQVNTITTYYLNKRNKIAVLLCWSSYTLIIKQYNNPLVTSNPNLKPALVKVVYISRQNPILIHNLLIALKPLLYCHRIAYSRALQFYRLLLYLFGLWVLVDKMGNLIAAK